MKRESDDDIPWTVLRTLDWLQLSVAVAPTNSQHTAWRLPGSGASFSSAPVDTEDHMFEATAIVNPSLPSTARLSSDEAERANHEGGDWDFEVKDLAPPPN